jgi:hypothetical protein
MKPIRIGLTLAVVALTLAGAGFLWRRRRLQP